MRLAVGEVLENGHAWGSGTEASYWSLD
jgi:hypothetical protein